MFWFWLDLAFLVGLCCGAAHMVRQVHSCRTELYRLRDVLNRERMAAKDATLVVQRIEVAGGINVYRQGSTWFADPYKSAYVGSTGSTPVRAILGVEFQPHTHTTS